MTTLALSDPAAVQERLEAIEGDLADLQNEVEDAAVDWFRIKRAREKSHAEAFIGAEGTGAERTAVANRDTADEEYETRGERLTSWEAEGRYEGLKARLRTLDTRAAIGMAILKSQGRYGA